MRTLKMRREIAPPIPDSTTSRLEGEIRPPCLQRGQKGLVALRPGAEMSAHVTDCKRVTSPMIQFWAAHGDLWQIHRGSNIALVQGSERPGFPLCAAKSALSRRASRSRP